MGANMTKIWHGLAPATLCTVSDVEGVKNEMFQNSVFRKMDEEDSMDGMDDEESKNPLAFLGLQRYDINATTSLPLYFYCIHCCI